MESLLLLLLVAAAALACPAMMWWQRRRGRDVACSMPARGGKHPHGEDRGGREDLEQLHLRHEQLAARIAELEPADERGATPSRR